jgi:hypothetical protein
MRRRGAQVLDPFQARGLAAQDEAPRGHDLFGPAAALQRGEVRRHDLQDVDAVRPQVLGEERAALGALLGYDVQAAAGGERGKDDRVAEVGREGRHRRVCHPRLELQALGHLRARSGTMLRCSMQTPFGCPVEPLV